MKRKIHIIGGPGSGKTYLAKLISGEHEIPHLDLDDIFWDNANGYGVRSDEAERDEKLRLFLEQPDWVIEGVYYKWLASSFSQADLVVVLTTPVWVRHWRVIRRFLQRKLNPVEVKCESLRSLIELLRYNHSYDGGQLQRALAAMPKTRAELLIATRPERVIAAVRE